MTQDQEAKISKLEALVSELREEGLKKSDTPTTSDKGITADSGATVISGKNEFTLSIVQAVIPPDAQSEQPQIPQRNLG